MDDTAFVSAENVGGRLRALRTGRGLTKIGLAKKLDPACTAASITKWERGECLPTLYYAVKLAKAFGVSMDELYLGLPPRDCEHIEAETVGKRIRAHRKHQKLTLFRLGIAIGMAEPNIIQWEADRINPNLTNAAKICATLGISLDELVGKENIIR